MLHQNILEEGAEAEDGLGVGGDLVQPEPEPDRGDTRLSVDLIRDIIRNRTSESYFSVTSHILDKHS